MPTIEAESGRRPPWRAVRHAALEGNETVIPDFTPAHSTVAGTRAHPSKRGDPQPLVVGTPAPDFSLHSTPDQKVALREFRGRPVILAFYPADWSPVCSDQMALYNALLPEFQKHNAQLLGISVDGVWCHAAFAKDRNLHFPLLADFEPKGGVSRLYGSYYEKEGESARTLFVIDGKGTIRWSFISPEGVNPGADGILAALEGLAPGAKPA